MLFLDEPTTGLDPRARLEVWEMVRSLVETGVTVVLTTQYLEEADHLAHEIAVVDRGRVVATGTPEELKAKAGARWSSVWPASGPSTVSVPVSDPALLPAILRGLDDDGIVIGELVLQSLLWAAAITAVFAPLSAARFRRRT